MIKLNVQSLLEMAPSDLSGKLIAFATDTVFGVGAIYDESFPKAKEKIFQMKERDASKPLAILISSFDDVSLHLELNDEIASLTKYWPGALTIIFKTKDDYFNELTLNHSIGIRMPNCESALAILKHLGVMAVTSINKSGAAPLNDVASIEREFMAYIDYLVVDEYPSSGRSSTVIDARITPYKILRQGEVVIK